MVERRRRSQSKIVASAQPPWRLFGEPNILEGEDAAAYEVLRGRIRAAEKPVDMIYEMFVDDVVSLEWEVLRGRRWKARFIRARGLEALNHFLCQQLEENYELYSKQFTSGLAEILQQNVPENQIQDAQRLAKKYAEGDEEAVEKVDEVLAQSRVDIDDILRDARRIKAKELVQGYAQHERDAMTVIDELFGQASTSIEALTAEALCKEKEFEFIERIDRLITIAEKRRNDALNEIERRRVLLGQALRRSVQDIEDGEFVEVIEAPAKGKNAA